MGFFDFLSMNTTNEYLTALALFLGTFIVFWVFDRYFVYVLQRVTKKTKTNWDDIVVNFFEEIGWPFFVFLAFYIGVFSLDMPNLIDGILNVLLIVFILVYISRGIIGIVDYALNRYKERQEKKKKAVSTSMLQVLKFILKLIIWVLAFLLALSNFGVNITPLIAGLGIGGLAIGLALQSILGDLFAAFVIYFDKPFQEGDFIIIGSDMGVIKHIGIKSTRIQALGGQELIVSNSELTSTRVNNYKKMQLRRVVFEFGVEYKTDVKQLKKIKEIVADVITKQDHARLDRVHFKNFGDSSLNFEVVYYIDSNDYNLYMDVQEKINFAIKEKVERLGVDFAFPSRTIYMRKDD